MPLLELFSRVRNQINTVSDIFLSLLLKIYHKLLHLVEHIAIHNKVTSRKMRLLSSIVPLVLVVLFHVVDAARTGLIKAGEKGLERNDVVKSFLDDNEAEEYEGIVVKLDDGYERPMLVVYDGGMEVDRVDLGGIRSKSELHRMMMQYQFKSRDPKELLRLREYRRQKENREAWHRGEKEHLKKPDYLNHETKELYQDPDL